MIMPGSKRHSGTVYDDLYEHERIEVPLHPKKRRILPPPQLSEYSSTAPDVSGPSTSSRYGTDFAPLPVLDSLSSSTPPSPIPISSGSVAPSPVSNCVNNTYFATISGCKPYYNTVKGSPILFILLFIYNANNIAELATKRTKMKIG
ncbi:uncharacterized protein LOC142980499 isoform X2 [Anticarsia gemmatalis]|uniref:uncharacterized protein LOC142980499 isoform X2 n=1 Tax=Anticarsia gemmatalis TaxID=129554 RepID=UPI003F76EBAC